MKSKILMLNNNDNIFSDFRNSDFKKKYFNRFNSLVNIAGYNALGTITPEISSNFPIENLYDSHIYKESRSISKLSGSFYYAGFTLELEDSEDLYDTICLQFNKFNAKVKEQGNKFTIFLELVKKTTGNVSYQFILNETKTEDSILYFEDYYGAGEHLYEINSGKLLTSEGLILIDKDLTKDLDKQEFKLNEYDINIYCVGNSSLEYFSLSNVFIGNSFYIRLDPNFNYKVVNLNSVSRNKRTGVPFTNLNSSYKEIKGDLKFFENADQMQFDSFISTTKDYPFYCFPLSESSESDNYKDSLNNLKWGGLFLLKKDFQINLKEYNLYLTSLELEEYK